jgi:hypothetical protein
VDTVPFGSYFRALFDEVGLFDESLLTNEDYEFNTRIRNMGKVVWFDPSIVWPLFSRPDLASLGRQYWRYGFWKAKMVKRYPGSIKPRQLMPPLFVAGLLVLIASGIVFPPAFYGLLTIILLYLGIIMIASVPEAAKRKDISLIAGIPWQLLPCISPGERVFLASIVTNRNKNLSHDHTEVNSTMRWRLKTTERRLILFLGDLAISWLGLLVALYFWSQRDQWLKFSWEFLVDRPADWFYLLPFIWLLLIIELYDVRKPAE